MEFFFHSWIFHCFLYSNAFSFCILILYNLVELIYFNRSLWFYIYRIIPLENSFNSSFPIWIIFISFSCLIALTRTSGTLLNKSSNSGYACLIPDLRKTFTVMYDVSCGSFIDAIHQIVEISFYFLFVGLSYKGVGFYQVLFASTEMFMLCCPLFY